MNIQAVARAAIALTALALASAPAAAPAAPLFAGRLDRSHLALTFEDQFDTFNWRDPRLGGKAPGRWRTWYKNGPDPFNINNRTLPGNKEMQAYLDPAFIAQIAAAGGPAPANPFTAKNGRLAIAAIPTPAAMRQRVWGQPYLSGMITTADGFTQQYGVFEMRAKLPAGRGVWPSFWMLPADGTWPPEIDILEVLGHDPTTLYSGYMKHGEHEKLWGAHVTRKVADLTKGFHTYGVEWGPRTLVFYLDDCEIARYPTPPDMHKPMFMIVSLAVGGKWPGAPDAATRFPATLEIDWIRAYKRQAPGPAPARLPPLKSSTRAGVVLGAAWPFREPVA